MEVKSLFSTLRSSEGKLCIQFTCGEFINKKVNVLPYQAVSQIAGTD